MFLSSYYHPQTTIQKEEVIMPRTTCSDIDVPAIYLPVIIKSWRLETLEKKLTEAIIRCARICADRNRGIIVSALSGGLDSSFCLAVIRKHFGSLYPIHTFTVGSSLIHPDIKSGKSVAECLQTIHHSFIPNKKEILGAALSKKKHPDLFRGEEPNGGLGPFFLFKTIQQELSAAVISVITHDGIDELLGGYWPHRQTQTAEDQRLTFQRFWKALPKKHLEPLTKKALFFGILPIFPYLQPAVVKYISRIPLSERTGHDESKIPLRRLAEKYLPPEIVGEVIQRKKIGFCDAMKEF